MSKYLAKKICPQYKNTIEKIHIAEHVILKDFIKFIKDILDQQIQINTDSFKKAFFEIRKNRDKIEQEAGRKIEIVEYSEK
ncbi:MAG: hypothetical protein PHF46_03580 [Candidatus Gracilibacteria bacterium]|nr:hypothetical protein [Candidatus Gracilibacteria bacterium]MDD3120461.1 hypothetical protein [Candidatus Gracilibacteria bacterium]